MRRLLSLVFIMGLLASCTTQSPKESADYKELQEQLETITNERDGLSQRVSRLEDYLLKLKGENTALSANLQFAFRDTVGFRKDILDIFSQMDTLKKSNEIEYYGIDYLDKNQKAIISEGIESYLYLGNEEDEIKYSNTAFIGENPGPFTLAKGLGIVESEPMFYFEGNKEKTLHFDVYYYKSTVWIDGESGGKPQNHFRGPFAGVGMFHLAIEEIEGNWKVVYSGVG